VPRASQRPRRARRRRPQGAGRKNSLAPTERMSRRTVLDLLDVSCEGLAIDRTLEKPCSPMRSCRTAATKVAFSSGCAGPWR
jgi:hypothetical protein